jgi:UDP-apiose/xylose synthase
MRTYKSKNNILQLLILGCGGFIGSHLLDRLFDNSESTQLGNFQVSGWDIDNKKNSRHLARKNLVFHHGEFHSPESFLKLEEEIKKADIVINLAAICNPSHYNTRPLAVIESNFLDSYQIVQLCTKYKSWLIHFSTSEVYGRTLDSYIQGTDYDDPDLYELDEDTTPLIMGPIQNQRWSYACAKQLLERFIYGHHKEKGLPFTIIRPLNFFGPRMDFIPGRDGEGVPRVLACFMTALIDNKPLQLVDGGKARRTIVSIRDAIRAIISVLERPGQATNQIFNIGNRDNEVTMIELAEMMREIYARVSGNSKHLSHPIENISSLKFYGEGYEDCDRRMPKIDKARDLLGWVPNISLQETLEETIAYYYNLYGKKD